MKILDFLKLYGALVLFHLAVIYRQDEGQMLWLSKPLLLVSLLAFAWHKKANSKQDLSAFIAALFFSLVGDIALMIPDKMYFLLGMGAFALAHLAYILHYLKKGLKWNFPVLISAVVVLAIAFFGLITLIDLPEELRLPVYLYFVIIGGHFIISALAFKSGKINLYPLIGILLFLFSDWWIAYHKFGDALAVDWHNNLLIMLSYAAAQGLIVLGVLAQDDQIGSTS